MRIKQIEEICATKWLTLKNAEYINKDGKEMKWDWVSRNASREVVTCICRSKIGNKYLLIAQPRVPVNKIVIEFPAGLVDDGETYEQAALRELKEETGYVGDSQDIYLPVVKSAGLSDEKTAIVEFLVDEDAVSDTEMEDSEDIQAFWMTPKDVLDFIKKIDREKYIVDTLVLTYFLGYNTGMTE
jgi:8-oxo-dGTP pyrophosphatase MutT (NUDIX family)